MPGGPYAQRGRIDPFVALLLPAVAVELLVEVALGVEETDADERHAEIR